MDNFSQSVQNLVGQGDQSSFSQSVQNLIPQSQALSSTPQSIQSAQEQIGSQADNGECQRFVEQQVYGKTGIFPSATDAANYYQQQGQLNPDINKVKPGDLVYFNDPSQPNGHVGIYEGNGKMVSATYNGVEEDNLGQWLQKTGQTPIGFVQIGGKQ